MGKSTDLPYGFHYLVSGQLGTYKRRNGKWETGKWTTPTISVESIRSYLYLDALLEGSMHGGAYLLLMQVCAKLQCNSTGAVQVGGVKQ
jgi:hypothetical protein